MRKKETRLQIAVSTFLKAQYPGVIFTSESSGIRVSMGLAVQMKRQRSVHKLPDMFIASPRGGYCGLFIELKNKKSDIYLKDGVTFRSIESVQEQLSTINELSKIGYKAIFCCGLDEAIHEIKNYLKNG